MEIIDKFNKDEITLNVYGAYNEPLFKAVDICRILGYQSYNNVINELDQEYKKKITISHNPLKGFRGKTPPRTYNFLTENGLYYLIMRCDLPAAKPFQQWVCNEVLPSIRKKGYYTLEQKKVIHKTNFKIETEYDLHTKVIDFLRNHYPTALYSAGLGELQDTKDKRIMAHKMGYVKGECDLSILNLHKKYSGLIFEFKSPQGTGIINKYQNARLKEYRSNGFKTLCSNDYDNIIVEIIKYMSDIRIKCKYCKGKFKSNLTLKNHLKYFHRIKENV